MRNRYKPLAALMVIGCFLLHEAHSAPFQNLDFESATLPAVPQGQYGGSVPISQGLPGWNAFLGPNIITQVVHNSVTLGSAAIWVWGPDWPYGPYGRIEGSFTVVLEAGSASGGPPLSIAQAGMVPLDCKWLVFKGRTDPRLGDFAVSLDGQSVPVLALASFPDYSLYGAEISTFAGREAELRFTVFRSLGNNLALDSIAFVVPEPGAAVLAGMGLGLLALRLARHRWKRPKPATG